MKKHLLVKIFLLGIGIFNYLYVIAKDEKREFAKSLESMLTRGPGGKSDEASLNKNARGSKESSSQLEKALPKDAKERDGSFSRAAAQLDRMVQSFNPRKKGQEVSVPVKSETKNIKGRDKSKTLTEDDADRLAREKKLDKIDGNKLKAARAFADKRNSLIEKVEALFLQKPELKPAIAQNAYLSGKEKKLAVGATVQGGADFHKILEGDMSKLPQLSAKPTKEEKQAYKESLHDMSWFLFNAAAKNDKGKGDKGMASGMILLDGPQAANYHQYIKNYVEAVSPYPRGKLIGLDKSASGAYERESSHFNGCRKSSYGIDLDAPIITRPAADGKPNYKTHLHVGQLDDGRVFIKFEQYGLGKQEFLAHAGGYVTKDLIPNLKTKFKGTDEQKEKSIQQLLDTGEIKNQAHNRIATQELESAAKANPVKEAEVSKASSLQRGEKWPKGYNPLFESMLKDKGVPQSEVKEIMKEVKTYGFQAMHKYGQEKGLEVTDKDGNKHDFVTALEKKYGPDVKNKFFNEVILKTDDLKKDAQGYHQALNDQKTDQVNQEPKRKPVADKTSNATVKVETFQAVNPQN